MEKGKQPSQRIKYDTDTEQKLLTEIIKRLDNLIYGLSHDKNQLENRIKRIKKIKEQQLNLQIDLRNTFEFY